MSEPIKFPDRERPPGTTVEEMLVGPFEEWRVVVEGRFIPFLTAFREGDMTALVVDHRFTISFPNDRFYDVAWLVANAMAVAQGYTNLAAESKEQSFAPIACKMDKLP